MQSNSRHRQAVEDTLIELTWRICLCHTRDFFWPDKETKQAVQTIFHGATFGQEHVL